MIDPRAIHAVEQFQALARDVAKMLAAYRAELLVGGVPEAEVAELVLRMEERVFGPVMDDLRKVIEVDE